MNIIIEHAKEKDALELSKIIMSTSSKVYSNTFPEDNFDYSEQDINNLEVVIRNRIRHGYTYIIAIMNDKIVGCINWEIVLKDSKQYGKLNDFYILEDYQRKGIGSKLFEEACKELSQKNINNMIVISIKGTHSIEFYKKYNYKRLNIVNYRIRNLIVKAYEIIYEDITHIKKEV